MRLTVDVRLIRDAGFEESKHPRGPDGQFYAATRKVVAKHGFEYVGENQKGAHVWKHPKSGHELRLKSSGGIGRNSSLPVATVKTGENREHTHQHSWPDIAVRGALKKAGY